jgi:hypothetical protein
MFLEPKDVATISGLPQHVYDEAARYDQTSPAKADGQPGEYVSDPGQVLLTPWNGNSSGLDLSTSATHPTDNQSEPGEKYEQGAKGLSFLHHGINMWNVQNALLGLYLGPEGAELLKRYSEPVAKGLVPLENGLSAMGEIKNGAAVAPTLAGAGIKTGTTLGAIELGSAGGGALGTATGIPGGTLVGGAAGALLGGFAPNWVYGHMSNEQIGKAAGRLADGATRSYSDLVINNPYYDPRLMGP